MTIIEFLLARRPRRLPDRVGPMPAHGADRRGRPVTMFVTIGPYDVNPALVRFLHSTNDRATRIVFDGAPPYELRAPLPQAEVRALLTADFTPAWVTNTVALKPFDLPLPATPEGLELIPVDEAIALLQELDATRRTTTFLIVDENYGPRCASWPVSYFDKIAETWANVTSCYRGKDHPGPHIGWVFDEDGMFVPGGKHTKWTDWISWQWHD